MILFTSYFMKQILKKSNNRFNLSRRPKAWIYGRLPGNTGTSQVKRNVRFTQEKENMNWDSFFSSVAQASASLIGVVLAFIISKILSEITDFDTTKKEIDVALIQVKE